MSIRKKLQDSKKKMKELISQFGEEDLRRMKDKAFADLEILESQFEKERYRQQIRMNKRLADKRVKMSKAKVMKDKVDAHEVDMIKSDLLLPDDDDKTFDQLLIENDEDKDSSLMRMLREWKRRRDALKLEEQQRQLSECVIDLDSNTLKKLIMKLDNLEKGLRELRRIQSLKLI